MLLELRRPWGACSVPQNPLGEEFSTNTHPKPPWSSSSPSLGPVPELPLRWVPFPKTWIIANGKCPRRRGDWAWREVSKRIIGGAGMIPRALAGGTGGWVVPRDPRGIAGRSPRDIRERCCPARQGGTRSTRGGGGKIWRMKSLDNGK